MKEIKLTQGKVALVDDEDFEYLNQWKWYAARSKNTYYATRRAQSGQPYKQITIQMHRLLMGLEQGNKAVIDHIDRNGLNNCKVNLRITTLAENNRNRTSVKGSSSKYLGVHLVKSTGKWSAAIKSNDKTHYLGTHRLGGRCCKSIQ